ncbi:MAG: hypothetical protein MZV64_10075 [Ignavibacteriales bacterium]|nr:hypothetical protein [Ignavibacteriales bacterium]
MAKVRRRSCGVNATSLSSATHCSQCFSLASGPSLRPGKHARCPGHGFDSGGSAPRSGNRSAAIQRTWRFLVSGS